MFTQNLIDAVEANWEQIATLAIDEIGRDARLPHMRQLRERNCASGPAAS